MIIIAFIAASVLLYYVVRYLYSTPIQFTSTRIAAALSADVLSMFIIFLFLYSIGVRLTWAN